MSSPSYKVLGSRVSTCTQTVLATLEEVGATYELQIVDALLGETRTPEYLSTYNPFGQIPALVDGDLTVFESRAIARYIAAKHGAKALYPIDNPQKLALVEQWLSANQSNNGTVFETFLEYFVKPLRGQTPDPTLVSAFKEKMRPYLTILNTQLSKTKYLAGDEYTLADLSYVGMTRAVFDHCTEFNGALEEYPSLNRWWKDISSRETWKKVDGRA